MSTTAAVRPLAQQSSGQVTDRDTLCRGKPARRAAVSARAGTSKRTGPARVSTRVDHQPDLMSEPELLLAPANRQRLIGHLLRLEAEAAVAEHPDHLQPPTTTTTGRPEPGGHASSSDDHQQAQDPTLSFAETAELLGVSRWLVQQAVHDGSLPSVRGGRRILIPRARLLAWLEVTVSATESALPVIVQTLGRPHGVLTGPTASGAVLVGAPRNPGLWTTGQSTDAARGRP